MRNIINIAIFSFAPFYLFAEQDAHDLKLADDGAAGPVRAYLITGESTLTILPTTPPGVTQALSTADYLFAHSLQKGYLPSAQTNTTITYNLKSATDYDTLQEVYFIGNEQITTRQTGSVMCFSFLKAFNKEPRKNEVDKFIRDRFLGFEKIEFTEGEKIKDGYVIYNVSNHEVQPNWHIDAQVAYKDGVLSLTCTKNGIFSIGDSAVSFDDTPENNKNFFEREQMTKGKPPMK